MNDLPAYIVSALKKGIKLHYAGHSGDGLVQGTIQMAHRGVRGGRWPDEKIIKASAWFKRHVFDREKMKNPSDWNKPPNYSPAYVAWLLWGDSGDGRGAEWIHKRADRIRSQRREAVEESLSVKVVKTGQGNKYQVDGRVAPQIVAQPQSLLTFNLSDESNLTHPLRLSLTPDGIHGGGDEIPADKIHGIPGQPESFVRYNLSNVEAVAVYYFCTNHPNMGSSINLESAAQENKTGGASTKAPPEDRIKGGRNTGRAGTGGGGVSLSPATNKGLRAKVSAHNDEYGNDSRKRVTLSMLQKVYLRAAGAFSTSHRPGMTRGQWSFGRVNAFLYLLRNLRPFRKGYTTDNDLLPSAHPLSPKKEQRIGGSLSSKIKAKENQMNSIKEYGRILSGMRYEMGKLAREHHCTEAERVELNQMLKDVDEHCCYGTGMKCRCDLHSLMMMLSKMLSRVKDADRSQIHHELEEMLGRYEGMAFGPMYDEYQYEVDETGSEPNLEGVEDPTAEQRSDLPAEAYEPSAFFANKEGDFDVDGDFRSSLSKLPHHINTVINADDNESVDIPRLRNALARFNQVDWSKFPPRTEMQTRAHLEKHADALLYGAKEGSCKNCKQEDIDALKVELSLFRSGEFEELARIHDSDS